MDRANRWILVPWVQPVLFCIGCLLLFFPNLQRTFASDDFEVIGRIAWEHRLSIRGTFRPLSDVSLFVNYLLGGWHPAGYYLFNILVHGINCYLVYRFCLTWGWGQSRDGQAAWGGGQREYALLAALFFMAYPFHSEGIDWILGRGASLCTLFGLAALLVALSGLSRGHRFFWAGLFYFVGMTAYEPAILLPIFCLIVLYIHQADRSELLQWTGVFSGVLLVSVAVRIMVSGVVAGEYGTEFLRAGMGRIFGNMLKVGGRLLLPPSDRSGLQIAVFAVVVIGLTGVLFFFLKQTRRAYRSYLVALVSMLAAACIVPVVTAVSTRTSESDRLLYLPSVFLCCILAFLLVMLVKRKRWQWACAALLLLYMVIFLEKTNVNWVAADAITRDILRVGGRGGVGRVYLINLPDEKDGAFIFRHGLPEAWRLAKGAIPPPIIVDHLTRDQALELPDPIAAQWRGNALPVPPNVLVRSIGRDSLVVTGGEGPAEWRAGGQDEVYYWDKQKLVRICKH